MNHEHLHSKPAAGNPSVVSLSVPRHKKTAGSGAAPAVLPMAALDDRIAIVGTAGSGKTYTAKAFVERLLDAGARVAIVDPLGVWWGLRAGATGETGYPVVVFGGRHADSGDQVTDLGLQPGFLVTGGGPGVADDRHALLLPLRLVDVAGMILPSMHPRIWQTLYS